MLRMNIVFELYLLEVQGDLGFQVAQVDPEDPANKDINNNNFNGKCSH